MASPATTSTQLQSSLRIPLRADKRKSFNGNDSDYTTNKLGTASAVGLITTLVMPNAEAENYRVVAGSGRLFDLYDSTDTIKATGTGKTITSVAYNTPSLGLATVTFAVAAAAITAVGDYMVPAGSNPLNYLSIDRLDARLAVLNATAYAGAAGTARLSNMTVMDKQYALMMLDDFGGGQTT